MTTPAQWAQQGTRVIALDDQGAEQARGVVVEWYPPTDGAVGIRVDGSSGIMRVPVERVRTESPAAPAILEALASVSGIGEARATEAVLALRRAGYDITDTRKVRRA